MSPTRLSLASSRSKTSFQTRLLLHLANRRRRSAAEGFTLVELMIVVAILGLLAAVALPNYLTARNTAAMSSRISEAVSFAKACAVFQATQVGTVPSAAIGPSALDGVTMNNCSTASTNATVTAKWGNAVAPGVRCLTATSGPTSNTATITVSPVATGGGDQITCGFTG